MGSASALASAVLLCEKAFRGHGLIQLKLALSCDLGKGKIFAYLNFVFVMKRKLNFDDLASFLTETRRPTSVMDLCCCFSTVFTLK